MAQSDYTDLGGDPWLVLWYDLGAPRKDTYSASAESGRARRSLLERYDHEFGFRVKVAAEAKAGGELVRPFHVGECGWCVWQEYCTQVAGPDDASFAIRTGLPTAQQWRYLYDLGKHWKFSTSGFDSARESDRLRRMTLVCERAYQVNDIARAYGVPAENLNWVWLQRIENSPTLLEQLRGVKP